MSSMSKQETTVFADESVSASTAATIPNARKRTRNGPSGVHHPAASETSLQTGNPLPEETALPSDVPSYDREAIARLIADAMHY